MQTFFLYLLMMSQMLTFSLVQGDVALEHNTEDNKPSTETLITLDKATMESAILDNSANEMGEVMVVMYHNLVDDVTKEGNYARTPENFKKDLERLWQENYIPVSMSDYITGNIDIPAGKSPVVFTFDDGYVTDISFLEDGSLDPSCAVGVFESVQKKHPEFVPKATFYLFGDKYFGATDDTDQKVTYLLERGYEIGNHTLNHNNLTKISEQEGKRIIIEQAKEIEKLTGAQAFHFSVPFGEKPKAYPDWMKDQTWLTPYTLLSSVNVGWNPIPSAYDNNFNPYSINRITVGEDNCELHYWMDVLRDNPSQKYISDGLKNVISMPRSKYEKLNQAFKDNFRIAIYDESGVEWIDK